MPPISRSRASTPRSTVAWLAVGRAYHLCDAVLSARLAPLGIGLNELELLVGLASSPGATQQELASRCFIAKSGMSMLLDRLEGRDLVTREADPRDARAKRLRLTTAGEALARRARQVRTEVAEAMAAGITAKELDLVADVMDRVAQRLEALR